MKIGLKKPRLDLSQKHISFLVNGKEHFIIFKYSWSKGIQDVYFDNEFVKIKAAYPNFWGVVKACVCHILLDLKFTICNFHKNQDKKR